MSQSSAFLLRARYCYRTTGDQGREEESDGDYDKDICMDVPGLLELCTSTPVRMRLKLRGDATPNLEDDPMNAA